MKLGADWLGFVHGPTCRAWLEMGCAHLHALELERTHHMGAAGRGEARHFARRRREAGLALVADDPAHKARFHWACGCGALLVVLGGILG